MQQNYSLFNGFQGFSKVLPPQVFGIDWRSPLPFDYLALAGALAAGRSRKWRGNRRLQQRRWRTTWIEQYRWARSRFGPAR